MLLGELQLQVVLNVLIKNNFISIMLNIIIF